MQFRQQYANHILSLFYKKTQRNSCFDYLCQFIRIGQYINLTSNSFTILPLIYLFGLALLGRHRAESIAQPVYIQPKLILLDVDDVIRHTRVIQVVIVCAPADMAKLTRRWPRNQNLLIYHCLSVLLQAGLCQFALMQILEQLYIFRIALESQQVLLEHEGRREIKAILVKGRRCLDGTRRYCRIYILNAHVLKISNHLGCCCDVSSLDGQYLHRVGKSRVGILLLFYHLLLHYCDQSI